MDGSCPRPSYGRVKSDGPRTLRVRPLGGDTDEPKWR